MMNNHVKLSSQELQQLQRELNDLDRTIPAATPPQVPEGTITTTESFKDNQYTDGSVVIQVTDKSK